MIGQLGRLLLYAVEIAVAIALALLILYLARMLIRRIIKYVDGVRTRYTVKRTLMGYSRFEALTQSIDEPERRKKNLSQ